MHQPGKWNRPPGRSGLSVGLPATVNCLLRGDALPVVVISRLATFKGLPVAVISHLAMFDGLPVTEIGHLVMFRALQVTAIGYLGVDRVLPAIESRY